MIDPLSQGPILDMFMGVGSDPASKIFQDLKRQADEMAAQQQAQNPGSPPPKIDYSALMQKAVELASQGGGGGAPPPSGMMPGETAGVPDGGVPGPWGRLGRTFQGEEIPADAARTARFKGLTDAGVALLGSAGEGNLGRGLAQGLSAFQGGMEGELEGFAERRRRRELDDLTRRRTEESIESSRGARGRAEAGEERAATTFEQTQEDRQATRKVMREQLREIEELAGPDSPEVDRARALVKGGPALREDLDELHERLIARERFPEDRAMETEAELERRKRLYEEDPGERFERGIERERLEKYGAGGYGRGGDVTPNALLSDMNSLAEQEFEMLLLERGGSMALRSYRDGMVPAGVDLRAIQREAEDRAAEVLERRREKVRGLRGGGEGGEGGGGGDLESRVQDVLRQVGGSPSPAALQKIRQGLGSGLSVGELVEQIQKSKSERGERTPPPARPSDAGAPEQPVIEPTGMDYIEARKEARGMVEESRDDVDALPGEIKALLLREMGKPPPYDEPMARMEWERELRSKARRLSGMSFEQQLRSFGRR